MYEATRNNKDIPIGVGVRDRCDNWIVENNGNVGMCSVIQADDY